jgi:hypothetical protein
LFYELNQSVVIRSDEDIKKLNLIIKTLKDIDVQGDNGKTQYLYHHIYSAYYFALNDLENCHHHLLKSKTIIDTDLHLFEDAPNTYFSIITNLTYVATKLKKYKEAS